jgi:hypothetical protein
MNQGGGRNFDINTKLHLTTEPNFLSTVGNS